VQAAGRRCRDVVQICVLDVSVRRKCGGREYYGAEGYAGFTLRRHRAGMRQHRKKQGAQNDDRQALESARRPEEARTHF
jgi:hypothetical protein